jgi:hypothetical protein
MVCDLFVSSNGMGVLLEISMDVGGIFEAGIGGPEFDINELIAT